MSGSDRVKFWLLLLGVAAAAVYSFWYAFKAWRENRVVADTPTSRVRSAAQGYVELTGHGVMPPHKETIAPLTGKPCTWWRYTIEERRASGRSRGWTRVDSGISEEPFVLDDGTGQCLIDPRGAEVFPVRKDLWYGSTEWPEVRIPDGQGFFGKLADVLLSGGHYRYTEYRLQPNETVCALGAYRSGGGVGVEDPETAVAALLHEWKQDQKSLLESLRSEPRRRPGCRRVGSGARGRASTGRRAHGGSARHVGPVRFVQTIGRPRIHVVGLGRGGAGAALAPQCRRRDRRMYGQHRRPCLDGDTPLIESRSEQPASGSGNSARLRSHRAVSCPPGARARVVGEPCAACALDGAA